MAGTLFLGMEDKLPKLDKYRERWMDELREGNKQLQRTIEMHVKEI